MHLHEHGRVEQEDVAQGGEGDVAEHDVVLDTEQVGVSALAGEAARVVAHILNQILQPHAAVEDAVVEAFFPQAARVEAQLSASIVAATFEATDDAAQVDRQAVVHEEDDVEMIGHHLMGDDLDDGVIVGDAQHGVVDGLAHGAEVHHGRLGLAVTGDMAQQCAAVLDNKGEHVDAAALIVVADATAQHRGLGLAGPLLLGFVLVPVHFMAKVKEKTCSRKFFVKNLLRPRREPRQRGTAGAAGAAAKGAAGAAGAAAKGAAGAAGAAAGAAVKGDWGGYFWWCGKE